MVDIEGGSRGFFFRLEASKKCCAIVFGIGSMLFITCINHLDVNVSGMVSNSRSSSSYIYCNVHQLVQ